MAEAVSLHNSAGCQVVFVHGWVSLHCQLPILHQLCVAAGARVLVWVLLLTAVQQQQQCPRNSGVWVSSLGPESTLGFLCWPRQLCGAFTYWDHCSCVLGLVTVHAL